MSVKAIVQLLDDHPLMCELDAAPAAGDQFLAALNPRRRDGSRPPFVDERATLVIIPWHRIKLVQILPDSESEEIISFVRD